MMRTQVVEEGKPANRKGKRSAKSAQSAYKKRAVSEFNGLSG